MSLNYNKSILAGRVCNDLELKATTSGLSVVTFNVAVDRYCKDKEKKTSFVSCVAWGNTAEHICRYWQKGMAIMVTGFLQSRTYEDKNNTTHYITEIVVEQVDFVESKSKEQKPQDTSPPPAQNAISSGSVVITGQDEDDDYPF